MKASMLLCDYAEELGGKLYVMGGGWSRNFSPNQPINMSLAVQLTVPWNEANKPYDINVRLVDDNHDPVQNYEGQDVGITGRVEVGRPPGLRPGSNLDTSLALTFNGLVLSPGTYVWEFLVDQKVLESRPFDIVDPNP